MVKDSVITPESFRHCCLLSDLKPTTEPPYSPVSHISEPFLPVTGKQQRSWPSRRTTNDWPCHDDTARSRRILKWLNATGLAISK